ncbi:uncharacterized protein Z520_10761 [Fonsecaea multimorphosa CBS 102226]|uniref:Large ribosomal subunit protein uL29m n=1 Tax=Fonsecaea multimorphosa CBS 102226 TaxID=1442371 RepID=A0A0D2KAQ9_9EURO|nr:uncharacterized protein Z520_10761 [Fonsecaea multimorphosa CBS 102226]KIX93583.1 hypothetical protein Z520_10761 [Fonsecaea multimorphosa CBS 102226]
MASLSRTIAGTPSVTSIPLFLAPAFARPPTTAATLSTPTLRSYATKKAEKKTGHTNWALHARPKIDRNKKRGVSAIKRTGPRSMRGLWKYPLPVPVARDHRGTAADYADSDDHGLWGFFDKSKQALLPPDDESSHGRAWTYKELSAKSFEDLHKLYWVCVKEQNRTLTREKERQRLRAGYGEVESEERVAVVRETMTLIREVLVDRQLSYNQARILVGQKEVAEILDETRSVLEDDNQLEPTESTPQRQ